jgi:hypothetical protein
VRAQGSSGELQLTFDRQEPVYQLSNFISLAVPKGESFSFLKGFQKITLIEIFSNRFFDIAS